MKTTFAVVSGALAVLAGLSGVALGGPPSPADKLTEQNVARLLEEGRRAFRMDTFGDEAFWGGQLKLHQTLGTSMSPNAALALGLKIDVDALSSEAAYGIKAGKVDLEAPTTLQAWLRVNAVIGVTAVFEKQTIKSVGIQCALCHSTVDNSLVKGIGHRQDGWPNRDLNMGGLIATSADLSALTTALGLDDAALRKALAGWGPGRFDAAMFLDGKVARPDGRTAATLIPPVYGQAGLSSATYTGMGDAPFWTAVEATLIMHGNGVLLDPRLADAARYPVAARQNAGNLRADKDAVTAKLAALHFYLVALPVPKPSSGFYAQDSAKRGARLFEGKARCAGCHVPPLYSEPGLPLHAPADIGIDDFAAARGTTGRYRTTPLGGLFTRVKGGFYHDGRFADLDAVVDHYNRTLKLSLTDAERSDLVEFLKSI